MGKLKKLFFCEFRIKDVDEAVSPSKEDTAPSVPPPTKSQDAPPEPGLVGRTLPKLPEGPLETVEARVVKSNKRRKGKVKDFYHLGKTLGAGGFAAVKLATDKQTGENWACKIMNFPPKDAPLGDDGVSRDEVLKEIEIISKTNHDNILSLKEFFLSKTKVYLITELLEGGQLLDALLSRKEHHYTEADAKVVFKQVLNGIAYLHERNVIHRDLKLENLLLVKPNNIRHIKIVDFGLARHTISTMATVCGTPQYVAPEVISREIKEYTRSVDMWSLGVILFILLSGYPPFYDKSENVLFNQIRNGDYNLNDPVWENVSDKAKDLVSKLLVVDPQKRLTIEETFAHRWIIGEVSKTPLVAAQKNMANQRGLQRFKKVGAVVVANNRLHRLMMEQEALLKAADEEDEEDLDDNETHETVANN